MFRSQKAFHNFFRIALDPRNQPSLPSGHLTKRGLSDGHPLLSGFAIRQRNRNRFGLPADQSLPETVQVLRPPGTWAVPGAFFLRDSAASSSLRLPDAKWRQTGTLLAGHGGELLVAAASLLPSQMRIPSGRTIRIFTAVSRTSEIDTPGCRADYSADY